MNAPKLEGETWTYPEGWSEEDRRTWEGIQGRKIAEEKRSADVLEAQTAAANAPAALLAAARAEADEATRKREAAERTAAGEDKWRAAVAQYGDRVRRILTVEGDILIMAAMSEAEVDMANMRAANLVAAAKGNELAAHSGFLGAHRDAMLAKVVYPDRDRVKALTKKYPSLWEDLQNARDALLNGRRDDEGKGSAL